MCAAETSRAKACPPRLLRTSCNVVMLVSDGSMDGPEAAGARQTGCAPGSVPRPSICICRKHVPPDRPA